VQFVINLHTHIASGLAEKQMAQLVTQMNNRDVKYNEQLAHVTEQLTLVTKQMGEQQKDYTHQMGEATNQIASLRALVESSFIGNGERGESNTFQVVSRNQERLVTSNMVDTSSKCIQKRCNNETDSKMNGARKKLCGQCLTNRTNYRNKISET
jgi:hypothetical protein